MPGKSLAIRVSLVSQAAGGGLRRTDLGDLNLGGDLGVVVVLAFVTFGLGVLLGFVGAGGAGLTVALLTSVFGLPVHEAIGTGLVAMCFVSVSGAASHFREGNISARVGTVVGVSGVLGAAVGANIGQGIAESALKIMAGLALWALAVLVWLRTRYADRILAAAETDPGHPRRDLALAVGLGLSGGTASGFFGVGMAPFLQLGLLTLLRLPLRQSVGTTRLRVVVFSLSGGISMALHGDVSVPYLVGTVVGLASGSYIGARYTRRASRSVLWTAVVVTPLVAGAMLLFL
jgi:uncharacterized membrane protein YfcA